MSEPLFLLGAGASFEAGLPRGGELTKQVLERMRALGHGAGAAATFHAVACLLAKSAARNRAGFPNEDAKDFERVLETLSLLSRKHLQALAPLVAEWDADLRDAIDQQNDVPENPFDEARATAALVALPRALELKDTSRVAYLKPLLELRDGARRVIATVNYDNAIEIAASDFSPKIPLETCIAPHGDHLDCWNRKRRIVPADTGVTLLKLHGSITWKYKFTDQSHDWSDEICEIREGRLTQEAEVELDAAVSGISATRRCRHVHRDAALIYDPVAKLGGPGPFVKLLGAFQDELWATDVLVIVGYSFRDEHINSVIVDWSGRGSKVVVVNGPAFTPDRIACPSAVYLEKRLRTRFVNTGLRAAEGIARLANEGWWPAADGGS